MTNIIGVSGYAGSGKDAFAKVLIEEFDYSRIAFADVLREVAYAIDPYVEIHANSARTGLLEPTYVRLDELVDVYGWDEAKNRFPDVRRLLQRIGTEAGRDILGENIWVETAFNNAPPGNIVVTDVRFPNELEAVKARGGYTVRIHRDGVGPRNDHPSETSLETANFDFHLANHGTLEELARSAREIAERVDRSTESG